MTNTITNQPETVKKGDLFYTSWGYDQTNYDYLVVLEVSKSGKSAKCQMTQALHMGTDGQCNVQEPVYCPYGDIFTMRLKTFNHSANLRDRLFLRGSYPFLGNGLMDRGTRLDTFSRAKTSQQFHETMSEYGH